MRFNEPVTNEDVQDSSFEPIPQGLYDIMVSNITDQTSKKGDDMLLIEFEIVDHNYNGRKIWEYWVFPEATDDGKVKTLAISRSKIAALATACGVDKVNDTDRLVGKTCSARVGIKPSDNPEMYPPKNVIKRFEANDNAKPDRAAHDPFAE